MTKNILTAGISLLCAVVGHTQTDSARVEQYCQLIATQRILSNKVTIDIDFGEKKSYWRDTRLANYEGKEKTFNSIIDAMNYMGREGWIFINAYPVHTANTEVFHFAFKRQCTKSEIQN